MLGALSCSIRSNLAQSGPLVICTGYGIVSRECIRSGDWSSCPAAYRCVRYELARVRKTGSEGYKDCRATETARANLRPSTRGTPGCCEDKTALALQGVVARS